MGECPPPSTWRTCALGAYLRTPWEMVQRNPGELRGPTTSRDNSEPPRQVDRSTTTGHQIGRGHSPASTSLTTPTSPIVSGQGGILHGAECASAENALAGEIRPPRGAQAQTPHATTAVARGPTGIPCIARCTALPGLAPLGVWNGYLIVAEARYQLPVTNPARLAGCSNGAMLTPWRRRRRHRCQPHRPASSTAEEAHAAASAKRLAPAGTHPGRSPALAAMSRKSTVACAPPIRARRCSMATSHRWRIAVPSRKLHLTEDLPSPRAAFADKRPPYPSKPLMRTPKTTSPPVYAGEGRGGVPLVPETPLPCSTGEDPAHLPLLDPDRPRHAAPHHREAARSSNALQPFGYPPMKPHHR